MPSGVTTRTLIERFRAATLADPAFPRRARVGVGVSGRCDSVALLHLLHGVASALSLQLTVVHAQHGDDPERIADAELVRALAESLALPVEVIVDAHPAATPEALSAARAHSFTAVRQRLQAAAIATGETLDDVAELLLTALVTGPPGELVIFPRAEGWVRPLLPFTHEECRAFLHAEHLPFRPDRDSLQLTTTRQRLRLLVLPLLTRHVHAAVGGKLAHTARALADDAEFLADLARLVRLEVGWTETADGVTVDAARFAALPASLARRVLADAGAAVTATPLDLDALLDFERDCRTLAPAATVTAGTLKVSRTNGTLTVTKLSVP